MRKGITIASFGDMKRNFVTWRRAGSVVLWALFVLLIFNPKAKALIIEGMMKAGFFQPDTPPAKAVDADYAAGNNFSVISPSGKVINVNELKGKVVFINFWATWCPPCIAEMGSVNELYLRMRNNPRFVIIMVDVDNDFGKSVGFMHRNHYQLPVYHSISALPQAWETNVIPTTIVVNKNGRTVIKHQGAADYSNSSFVRYLERLINN